MLATLGLCLNHHLLGIHESEEPHTAFLVWTFVSRALQRCNEQPLDSSSDDE